MINNVTNLLNELSHKLAEYYCNLDMILEYVIDDNLNEIQLYVEGEDLLINFGDNDEYVELETNELCKHKYSSKGTYKVTIAVL